MNYLLSDENHSEKSGRIDESIGFCHLLLDLSRGK
jgi:hypothetical protein